MVSWARFDDGFLTHPKVLRAGEEAANLFMRSVIYCAQHLTDGAIPREALRVITERRDAAKLAARLVAVGLFEETPDGWQIHDYTDHNPTREAVEERRRKTTAKVASWRERKAASSGNTLENDGCNPVTNRFVTGGVTDHVTLPPSRPVPARPLPESETTSPPAADDAGASPAAPEGGRADTAASGARGGATKARRGAPTDSLPPERGTGAARALEALRACPTLWAIVARPNALCTAIGGEAYPAVDVAREIFAAEAWLVANPKNRKSDGPRFLTSWLTTAQNRAPRVAVAAADPVVADDPWVRAMRKAEERGLA